MKANIIVIALSVISASALFEWIQPETWRRETKDAIEQAKTVIRKDTDDMKEGAEDTVNRTKGTMSEGYQRVKEGAKSARDTAEEYLVDPLRRLFSPSSANQHYEESEWLYQTLLTVSPPRHFFRTFSDEYILFVDCPGIPPSAIKVNLSNSRNIKIQGSHEACIQEKGHGDGSRLCVERQFDREYRYPEDVNPDAVECAIKDGVLAIRFPRIHPTGREIPVKQVKNSF